MASKNETKLITEPGGLDTLITREFDAPRELVFRAFVDPKLYVQWLGPRGAEITLETFEPRFGGTYRYYDKDYSFCGVFHEVTAPERIIQTFEYEGLPEKGHVVLSTWTFEALPGDRTLVTEHAVYPSSADLEGMMEAGAMTGVNEGYEKLDELLAKLK